MTVKFLDLQMQYRSIKAESTRPSCRTLDSAAYVLGPEVEAFVGRICQGAGCCSTGSR